LTGKDFIIEGKHKLSEKENTNNKTNVLSRINNTNQFPTSQAVIDYIDSIFNLELDGDGNIILNLGIIDGNDVGINN
jgi:hypothetical protein